MGGGLDLKIARSSSSSKFAVDGARDISRPVLWPSMRLL